jgi:cell division protein FtsB
MPEENVPVKTTAPGKRFVLLRAWALGWHASAFGASTRRLADRLWRPAGTVVAVILALLVTWHVVYGTHGLSIWQHKRAEDRALQREIKDLQQENAQMRQQIDHLNSDPDAIEREAREKLHYAKPGEIIVTLPDESHAQPQTAPAK